MIERLDQWSFLVPLIGGRQHVITQLAIYKWYISGIYCQLDDYLQNFANNSELVVFHHQPIWKNMRRGAVVKMGEKKIPNIRGENSKHILKFHHLVRFPC